MYYLPSKVFSRAKLSLAPVTTGSLTLALTNLNLVTLWRFLHRLGGPIHGSARQLQTALSSLQTWESDSHLVASVSARMPAGFDLLMLNVEHTIKTKVMALRQLSGSGSFARNRHTTCPICVSLSVRAHFHDGRLLL